MPPSLFTNRSDNMVKAGFLVNPVAGCGQFLNLKGSDKLTPTTCPRYISLEKAIEFLEMVKNVDTHFFTASGIMGKEALEKAQIKDFSTISSFEGECTSKDTENFIHELKKTDAEILIFFGGDGTARDIYDGGWDLPVIAVPLGTKMYSSVFAVSVLKAATLFKKFSEGSLTEFSMEEVIDLDETAYLSGAIEVKTHGFLKVPVSELVVLESKAEYPETSPEGIAEYVVEHMENDVNYLVGPGSTCKAILTELGEEGSLLGFDLVRNREVVGKDLSEKEIFEKTGNKTVIIISPIGGQGFLIGRGNKQLSGRIISAVGFQNVMVVSSEIKMRSIEKLYVDIDAEVEDEPHFIKVLFGYGRFRVMPVVF